MTMTTSDRLDRLDTMIAEGRIVRKGWGTWAETTDNGRETACLLAALSPEAGFAKSATACPAEVMPAWMAHLTVWLDDAGSAVAWPAMVRRYAAVARRWHVLTMEDWRRLDYTVRRVAVEEALSHIPDGSRNRVKERAAGAQVIPLCRRGEAGDYPRSMEWEAVMVVPGAHVPWLGEAWAATRMAAWSARIVAGLAEEARVDRITDAILDAINAACDRRTAAVS